MTQLEQENQPPTPYLCKHSQWLAYVLGHTSAVREYDQARAAFKAGQRENKRRLKELQHTIKQAVLKVLSDLQEQLCQDNHVLNRRKVCEKILSSWTD